MPKDQNNLINCLQYTEALERLLFHHLCYSFLFPMNGCSLLMYRERYEHLHKSQYELSPQDYLHI